MKYADKIKAALPLGAVLLGAAALRLWGIGFGLPHTEARPDESTVIFISLRALLWDPAPASLVYPTAYTYLLSVVYAAYALLAKLLGCGAGLAALLDEYAASPENIYLINRWLVALSGVATVLVVYKTAKLRAGARAGFLAALFMAVCYLHVRDSHFGTLDVPMTLFVVWSVFYAAKWQDNPSGFNYVLAGLLAGLATGTKYVGILLAVHGVCAHLAAAPGRKIFRALCDKKLWLFEGALVLGFLVSTPHAFLSFGQLVADFSYHKNLHGVMHGSNLWHHVSLSLNYGLGWPLLAAAFAGFMWCAVAQWRLFAALFPFTILYFAAAEKVSSGYVRYAIPLLPFFCLSAALLCERALSCFPAVRQRVFAVVLAALLAALPLYSSIRLDALLSRPDSRNGALSAARTLIPDGASIGVLCGIYGCPALPWDGEFYKTRAEQARAQGNEFKARLFEALDAAPALSGGPRYRMAAYDPDRDGFRLVSGQAVAPDWALVEKSQLENLSALPQEMAKALRGYEPAFSVEAMDLSCSGNRYDQEDAFYLPYSGFACVQAPGPNLYFLKKS